MWINERQNRRALLVGVLISASMVLGGCSPVAEQQQVEFKVPVSVAKVTHQDIEELVVALGTIRAQEIITLNVEVNGELEIASNENGRLAEGEQVKQGDRIASIKGEDVRLATNMRGARNMLDIAKKNLEAADLLIAKKLISIADYGGYKAAYEESLHTYEKSLLTQQQSDVITPVSGVILALARENGQLVANGQLVTKGQMLAQVAALDTLIVDVDVMGADIARVRPGMVARVTYHAWQDKVFSGRVLRLSPTIDEQTRALRVEVAVDNTSGLLRPGMYAEVSLVVERHEQAVVISRQSVIERGGQQIAFVVDGERAVQRRLELGLDSGDMIEVISGLEAGEEAVLLGLETLMDQMPVNVTRGD